MLFLFTRLRFEGRSRQGWFMSKERGGAVVPANRGYRMD